MLNRVDKSVFTEKPRQHKYLQKQSKLQSLCESELISLNSVRALKSLTFAGVSKTAKPFALLRADENNPKWENLISRQAPIYKKDGDLRSEFKRDFDRIQHSDAYKRMKNKTQVFINPDNDHVCTRSEHVDLVASISEDIARNLGLNTMLARAIAIGHDMGHTPFGHEGERSIKAVIKKHELNDVIWRGHEYNGLRFADKLETLPDHKGKAKNLNLTYAVRDGIVSHCGEVNQNGIKPREEFLDLEKDITVPGKYQPYTWEGCVVKIADKISYLGRDIADAERLGLLASEKKKELVKLAGKCLGKEINDLSNTTLIGGFIKDISENSSPEKGICFSKKYEKLMNSVKKFNLDNIYISPRKQSSEKYAKFIIGSLFDTLNEQYDEKSPKKGTLANLKKIKKSCPKLGSSFEEWINKYSDARPQARSKKGQANKIIYRLDNKKDYQQAAMDFITGMTDRFAIATMQEIAII